MDCGADGFSGDVELDVIGVAVEVETMSTYDVAKGEHVEDEQERTTHSLYVNYLLTSFDLSMVPFYVCFIK